MPYLTLFLTGLPLPCQLLVSVIPTGMVVTLIGGVLIAIVPLLEVIQLLGVVKIIISLLALVLKLTIELWHIASYSFRNVLSSFSPSVYYSYFYGDVLRSSHHYLCC